MQTAQVQTVVDLHDGVLIVLQIILNVHRPDGQREIGKPRHVDVVHVHRLAELDHKKKGLGYRRRWLLAGFRNLERWLQNGDQLSHHVPIILRDLALELVGRQRPRAKERKKARPHGVQPAQRREGRAPARRHVGK